MRIIRTGQDLRGQTLDASLTPDGHARLSLVRGCRFDASTRFLGDIRGTDFLANDGPADWSGADTHACYWRGNTNLAGSRWPTNIGHLHHQPVGTIIKDAVAALPIATRTKVQAVADKVLTVDAGASWDTSKLDWWDGLTDAQRRRLRDAFRTLFAPYPQLAARFEELLEALLAGTTLWTPSPSPRSARLWWPDGLTLDVDASTLSPDRYSAARQLEALAGTDRHVFVYSLAPIFVPRVMPLGPDQWLDAPWGGY